MGHQIDRRIGDVNRGIICSNLAAELAGFGLVKHHVPGSRFLGEIRLVVHQQIRAVTVGHAIALAVHRVEITVLQETVHILVIGDEIGINRLHQPTVDQS